MLWENTGGFRTVIYSLAPLQEVSMVQNQRSNFNPSSSLFTVTMKLSTVASVYVMSW
jgi:hypothetical protein